jgi:acetolactate synthase-1/2/3 large subunit
MKVADFIIQYLGERGVDTAFVISGAANGIILDAFNRTDKIRYVTILHEQAAGFAAEGYAKISGKFGVAIATSGPGGMNLITPMGNCFYDSVPCLFITGQINSGFLRPDPAVRQVGFQEADIVAIATPVTKYAKLVKNPEDIKYELEKAIFMATEGRPGPVLLDIPQDVQKKEIDPSTLRGFDQKELEPKFDITAVDAKINAYLDDLAAAKRPVMIVGGGVRIAHGVPELLEVAKLLKIPVFPTWNALDVATSDFEYYGGRIGTYGGPGRNFGIQNSDLLLAVGSRISGRITGGNLTSFMRKAKKYAVDVDRALLETKWQQVPLDVNIYCDAKLFLERLRELVKARTLPDFSEWVKQVIMWREKYDPVLPKYLEQETPVNPYAFVHMLSAIMKNNDIYVADCGGNIVVSNHAFKTKMGQRYFTNNGNSPMGFSFAGAIGAAFAATKDQQVVCMIGDGGFNMNIQELQTLKTYDIPVKTFIMNNHSYGIIKAYQDTNLEGRYVASDAKSGYVVPDFIKIAEAYGVKTVTIKNRSEMEAKIKEVLEYAGPVVCDLDCGLWYDYSPRIFGFKTPIEDMYPYLPREEFRKNMIIDPLPGWEEPELPQGDKAKKAGGME